MSHNTTISPTRLDAFDPATNLLNVIVDTPKGSRNKYSYHEKHGFYKLINVLPLGAVFPFDFGYVPSTLGGDGDALDALLLMDEPAFTGCLVQSRLLGVIKARQRQLNGEENTKWSRNDRLLVVPDASPTQRDLNSLEQLNALQLDQIEHFFISYNQMKGKVFEPLGRCGAEEAETIVRDGMAAFLAQREQSSNATPHA